jgi:O-antigen chain-terminating methyltransferase
MREKDSAEPPMEELAREIRRAVKGLPPGEEGVSEPESDSAWDAAERFLLPSVEPGAKLAGLKRLLLRILRVVTRPQGTFNARMLEGARELERRLGALSFELSEEARERIGGDRTREEELQSFDRRISALRREIDVLHARISPLEGRPEHTPPAVEGVAPAAPSTGRIPPGFYLRFEEEFRGPEALIRERQLAYVEFFRGAPGPLLDCGCGRGEFLELLRGAGIAARGVDTNAPAVALARDKGLDVELGDLFSELRRSRGLLGGVSALQVVEHLEPPDVFEFLRLAHQAMAPGGRILVETINPDSLYALRAYRLDPTHRWPVPADTLALMAREAGFAGGDVRYLSPVPAAERLEETGDNERKLNRWIFGPQDYAFTARRPGA